METFEKIKIYMGKVLVAGGVPFLLYTIYTATSIAHGPIFKPPPPPSPPNDHVTRNVYTATSITHGPVFKPPPPPPPPNDQVTRDVIKKDRPKPGFPVTGSPAGAFTGAGSGPQKAATGAGNRAITKKKQSSYTTPISWEYWWARNRFQYLSFPNILDITAPKFPFTPIDRNDLAGQAVLNALKIKCVTLFRPMLNDKSARLKRAALIGLARLNDYDSLPNMQKLLRDGNQTVRDAAILALGILQSVEAKHTLLHIAQGTKTACNSLDQSAVPDYFRGFAEVSLALGKAQGVNGLLKTLSNDPDNSKEVRAMALEGLGLLGGEDSAKFLIDFIEGSQADPELVGAAVTALSKTEVPFTLPLLERSLFSQQIAARQSAALGLGRVAEPGDEKIVKSLNRCYRHTNDQALRGFTLVSMGLIGGPLAVEYLDQALVKGHRADCPWACLGLGFALRNHEDDKVMQHLMGVAFSHANRSTRGAAVMALGLARYKKAVESLIRQLKGGDDPAYRGYCAMALGMIGNPSVSGPLRRALQEEGLPPVISQAAMALALIKDHHSVPHLINALLNSNNDTTKAFIALSLGFTGDYQIVEKIHDTMIHDNLDDLTLAYCVHVSSKLLSGRTTPYLERLAAGSNFASEYPLVEYLLDFGF